MDDCLVLLQVAGGGGLVGAAVAGEAEPHVNGVVVVLEVGGGVGDVLALAAGVLHPAVDGDVMAAEGAHGCGPVLALVTRVLHLVNETNHLKLRNKLAVFLYSILWMRCSRVLDEMQPSVNRCSRVARALTAIAEVAYWDRTLGSDPSILRHSGI
jgi:hypothetical protein